MTRPDLNLLQRSLSNVLDSCPLDEKWLLAPSLRIGFQWLDAAALSGRVAVNVRVKTLRGMAAELAGPEMARLGVSRVSDLDAELLTSRLLSQGGPKSYFAGLEPGWGLTRAVLRAVREIRQAGLYSGNIEDASFEVDAKGGEIRRIATGYEQALEKRRLVDDADIARMAAKRLEGDPWAIPEGALAIVPKETADRLKGLDRSLIKAFPENRIRFLPSDEPDDWRHDAGRKSGIAPTSIFRAIGEVNEVKEALRRCSHQGVRLDEVEILHTDSETYLPLIHEIASSLWDGEIPVTFSEGVPIRCSRPGRAFMAWLSWADTGFPEDVAARMLAERLVEIDGTSDPIACLIETAPVQGDPPRAVLEKASKFVDLGVRSIDELDGYARQMLKKEISALASCSGLDDDHRLDVADWLQELPNRLRVGGKGPRQGCVHVAPLSAGGYSGRRYLVAIGLDDARFPAAGGQDPLLLDMERRRISGEMRTSDQRLAEERSTLELLLSRSRGEVDMGFCCRSLVDDQRIFASSAVVEQHRRLSGDPESDQEELAKQVPPVSFAPDASDLCVCQAEWWLLQTCGKGNTDGLRDAAHRIFPHLARGEAARAARRSDRFTEYDGYVPDAGADLDPLGREGPVMSASRLETVGSCPMDFFFKYALDLRPPEKPRRDRTAWLDPSSRGRLVHEVFRRFLGALLDRGLVPEFDRDWNLLAATIDDEISAEASRTPPPNNGVVEIERREIRQMAGIFLKEQELICRDSRPLYLEASIGVERQGKGTSIDTDDPVEVELSNRKRFRAKARIDRVDELPSKGRPCFALWDYKTGGSYKFRNEKSPFGQGRTVQNVLYALVAESRLSALRKGAKVGSFGYFFTGLQDRGRRIVWTADELARGKEVLLRLCEAISSGCFAVSNDPDDLKYSDYLEIHGDEHAAARDAERKLENADNRMLGPLRALREVEVGDG